MDKDETLTRDATKGVETLTGAQMVIRALKDQDYRADWEAYTESTGRPEVTLGDHFKHLK